MTITELNSVPSMGALLGSRGSDELIASINASLGSSSYFGSSSDRYAEQHQFFMKRFIDPIKQANRVIGVLSEQLLNTDIIKPLETENDLRAIPPCMMVPILTYEPVYSLLKQGRIEGWGYSYDDISPFKETYDRLIRTNGLVEFNNVQRDEDGAYWSTEEYWSTDPKISFEDRISIEATEEYINKILRDTVLDPTNLDELRG